MNILKTDRCAIRTEKQKDAVLFWLRTEYAPSAKGFEFESDRTEEIASFDCALEKSRMLAVYQHKNWWMRPAFPEGPATVPERTQLLLARGENGYIAWVAVCHEVCRCDISGTEEGLHFSVSSNGCPVCGEELCLVLAEGTDPYQCIRQAVRAACAAMGRSESLRDGKTFPPVFEKFGWCTWDAFYHQVNAEKIEQKMEELKEKGIPLGWVLIDDGWSEADYECGRLIGLDADTAKFPEGLSGIVDTIKNRYGVPSVGVWHAMMGYWKGFCKDTALFHQLSDSLECKNETDIVLKPERRVVSEFYRRWYKHLAADCGIDFVKADGQGSASIYYKGDRGYGEACDIYSEALEEHAASYFNGNLINCMGMTPQNMWHRRTSALSRSSDDFVPQVQYSFREHALQNSFNSLLQGQFLWGDWDMFWSSHEEAKQSAMLRAVSGGPVYISDPLETTDRTYIAPLVMADATIARCTETGLPTLDCLFCNPIEEKYILKVFNSWKDTYLLALFNLYKGGKKLEGSVACSDVPAWRSGRYLCYLHSRQSVCVLDPENSIELALDEGDSECVFLLPLNGHGRFIGLLDHYLCGYAVLSEQAETRRLYGRLSQGGRIAFYVPGKVERVLADGRDVHAAGLGAGCYYFDFDSTGAVSVEIWTA